MTPPAIHTLRARLIALVLLIVLPGLGLSFATALDQRRLARREARRWAVGIARLAANEEQHLLDAAHQFLAALARSPAVVAGQSSGPSTFLADIVRLSPRFTAVCVYDPRGDFLYGSVPARRAENLGRHDYFRRAAREGRSAVGRYGVEAVTGKPALPISYPVFDDRNRVKAILVGGLDLAWLTDLASHTPLPDGASLTLIDRDGTILARYPSSEWAGSAQVAHPIVREILSRREGVVEGSGLDGVVRLYAYTPLRHRSESAVYVAVGIPLAAAYTAADRILLRNLAWLGVAALSVLVASWAFGKAFVLSPVGAIVRAANRVEQGDLEARTGLLHGGGEFGRLAHAFDTMAEALDGREEERQRAEKVQRRLWTAVEQVAEAVIITDPSGTIEYVNSAFETVTGFPRGDATGSAVDALLSRDLDVEAPYGAMWGTVREGKAWQGRFVSRRKDGSLYHADTTVSPLRDSEGRITNFVLTQRDVTDRLKLEAQLLQAQKLEAVGRLAGGVAHDFNNLLQVILGQCELLLRRLPPADASRPSVDAILRAAERAAALTRQLLAFSRRQVLEFRVLDLNEVVQEMEVMLRGMIGEDVQLTIRLDPLLRLVCADAGQIEQVLMNLAVNARDAMPQGGSLTVETANADLDEAYAQRHGGVVPGPHVMLVVSDTGCGMDEPTLVSAFEPFFTTKERGKGTGLGLSTAFGIVTQSGGHISVSSEPGQGSAFKVFLPVAAGNCDAPGPTPPGPATPGPATPGGTETVLLVEDEEAVRGTVARFLAAAGYRVLEASTPASALRQAEEHQGPIHLLVTDVVMPGMGGPALAQSLRVLRPETKVLCISVFTGDAMESRGMPQPAFAFLQKPFSQQSLALKVRKVLDSGGAPPAESSQGPGRNRRA